MRILVIDDNLKNLEAAKKQLGDDHELVLCSSYEQAEMELTHVSNVGYDSHEYGEHYKEGKPRYDLVITTDLFLPPHTIGVKPDSIKDEVPYGLPFALAAIYVEVLKWLP